MENNLKFNSAICTSREQSERLLALGLKKETADMCHTPFRSKVDGEPLEYTEHCSLPHGKDIPAWSLGRLWELYWSNKVVSDCLFGCGKYMNPYAKMIAMIEYDIEDGTFNKDYLDK